MSTTGNLANVVSLPTPITTPPDTFITIDANLDVVDLCGWSDHIDHRIKFGDDTWDLTGHPDIPDTTRPTHRRCEFGRVPELWRPLVKVWVLLQADVTTVAAKLGLDEDETQLHFTHAAKPVTLTYNTQRAGLVLSKLWDAGLVSLDIEHWSQATTLLQQATPGPGNGRGVREVGTAACRQQVSVLQWLHQTGPLVGWPDPFGTEPWDGATSVVVFPSTGSEDQGLNSVRPTPDVFYVLGVATFIIDNLAPNILEHLEWWTNQHNTVTPPANGPEARQMLVEAYVAQGRQHGAVAGTMNRVHGQAVAHKAMSHLLGNCNLSYERLKEVSLEAVELASERLIAEGVIDGPLQPRVGVSPCPVEVTHLPSVDTGELVPWATDLVWTADGLKWWVQALVWSVAYSLQATLGMRDLDRDLLAIGCVEREEFDLGGGHVGERFWLHAWKQKRMKKHRRVRFPINRRLADAISYLEQLHVLLGVEAGVHPNDPKARCLFDAGLLNSVNARTKTDRIHLNGGWLDWFRGAAVRLHEAGVIAQPIDHVESLSGTEIRISALQAMADRPLGRILAARMGNHSSVGVLNGYIGDVTDRWAELDDDNKEWRKAQQAATAARVQHLASQADTVSGRGAGKLLEAIERHPDVFDAATPANLTPLTNRRMKDLGEREKHLETGVITHCFYDPDKALCGGEGRADFRACQPGQCANSVMTEAQVATVELRRRFERNVPALAISVRLVEEDMGEILRPFETKSDQELKDIVDADTAAYWKLRCGTEGGES